MCSKAGPFKLFCYATPFSNVFCDSLIDDLDVDDTCKYVITNLQEAFLSMAKSCKCTQSTKVTAQ